MLATAAVVVCLAYLVGLSIVSVLIQNLGLSPSQGAGFSSGLIGMITLLVAGWVPRYWRLGPRPALWGAAGLVALIAVANYTVQMPSPAAADISQVFTQDRFIGSEQVIWGTVKELPRLSRSDRGQIWLQVQQMRRLDQQGHALGEPETVQGKLYVTADWDQAKDAYPGQAVMVTGRLYEPSPEKNPNGFDFQAYLADNNCFAGFSASKIEPRAGDALTLGLWRIQQRIVRAQVAGLGSPAGELVSAMALGRKPVNLPYEIQDAFVKAGLAHTLAASGFHVSLVLGVVLGSLKACSARVRVIVAGAALIIFVGLTGAQPSVMRAALMGSGTLIGLALERKVKPLGCLLVAVTLLLLWQPGWIDNVGFRLSVMATFGLMVAVQPLMNRLSGLPPALASLVAVPIAAYLWTIPLTAYHFNTLSTYSILLNIAVTPLVVVLSLGGIFSGLVAAFVPGLGSLLASLLYYPAHWLIALVNWTIQRPGSAFVTGHIALWQMLGLYGLFCLGWLLPWGRPYRWGLGLLALVLALGPLWGQTALGMQVTVLAAGTDPVMVVQDHRQALLIQGGAPKTAFYTVAPFLRQAGISQLSVAVAWPTSSVETWQTIAEQTPIQRLINAPETPTVPLAVEAYQPFSPEAPVQIGSSSLQPVGSTAAMLRLTLPEGQTWLMVSGGGEEPPEARWPNLTSDVLWWDGGKLSADLLATVNPQVAIASGYTVDAATENYLRQQGVSVWVTERDGAVLWSPRQGFQSYLHMATRQSHGVD